MKKTLLIALVTILSVQVQAQLLWKVSGNGIERPSYIFGTHHLAPSDSILSSHPSIDAALQAVDCVYGEVLLSDMASAQNEVMAALQAPADSTLTDLFTAAQLDSIGTLLTSYAGTPVNPAMFAAFKPAMLSTQLEALRSLAVFPGFNPARQLDALIQTKAAELGKKVGGLETIAFQIKLLYGSPVARQAADLMKSVRLDGKLRLFTRELTQAYTAGDLERLHALMNDPETGMTPEEAETLINSRNHAWVSFMIGALTTAPMFIAVGAGHLPGPNGLINLLRSKGYTVEPAENSITR